MKKLFIISAPIIIGAVVFCTQSFAGDNGKEKKNKEHLAKGNLPAASTPTCTFCCLDNTDKTATCDGTKSSVVLGKTCAEMGCASGDCPNAWSWSPTTYLSCSNCQKPIFLKSCGPGAGGSITYTVTAWNSSSNCCAQITKTLTVTYPRCECTGRIGHFSVDEEKENKNIGVFPNPSTGKVTVKFEKSLTDALLQVYDIQGALVNELIVNAQTMQIDLSKNPKGVYFIYIVKDKESLLNKKIIIE